jgi:hypothetical protein
MEALKNLDDVAYVRFASVYRNFREARDFEELLGELAGGDEVGGVGVDAGAVGEARGTDQQQAKLARHRAAGLQHLLVGKRARLVLGPLGEERRLADGDVLPSTAAAVASSSNRVTFARSLPTQLCAALASIPAISTSCARTMNRCMTR